MDFIPEFVVATDNAQVPESFRIWSAVSILAATIERKVWMISDKGVLYPNMFICLTGDPATGKSLCISWARELLISLPELKLGPDNPTKASFIDRLEQSVKLTSHGTTVSAMMALAPELGVLISEYDTAFLNDLSLIYDNPPIYDSPRRTSKSVKIEAPTVNILAGVTPGFLSELMPEVAWVQGFSSRMIYIYGAMVKNTNRNVFAKRDRKNLDKFKPWLNKIYEDYCGEMEWEEDAMEAFNYWVNTGKNPEPTYGKLLHYNSRRDSHLLRLCMLSAISGERFPHVTMTDFKRASQWLFSAEAVMPDIFRAMSFKSDIQLLQDMHYHFYIAYTRVAIGKRIPLKERDMVLWLTERVESYRVKPIFDTAVNAGFFRPSTMPGEFLPNDLTKAPETIAANYSKVLTQTKENKV